MILLFLGIVVFNLHPESNQDIQIFPVEIKEKPQLTYLFQSKEGTIYDIFGGGNGEHGAPQDWAYLFDDTNQMPDREEIPLESIGSGQEKIIDTPLSGESIENPTSPLSGDLSPEIIPDETITPNEEENNKEVGKRLVFIRVYLEKRPDFSSSAPKPSKGIQIIPSYASCVTPRGYRIAHGESVLAYRQHMQTPDTCMIERRLCQDGKLSGTFWQQSCNENTSYNYYQEQFVAYNTNKKSDLVQPSPIPSQGETIYAKASTDKFIKDPNPGGSSRGSSKSTPVNYQEVEQTEREYPNCRTPRGESVQHGQFIKAYKHKNGFNDAPCQVQLRTCILGKLEGSFSQMSCRYWETSYIDWLNGSPTRDTYSQQKMERIQMIRDNEVNYEKEYGNSLSSAALDKILGILDL